MGYAPLATAEAARIGMGDKLLRQWPLALHQMARFESGVLTKAASLAIDSDSDLNLIRF